MRQGPSAPPVAAVSQAVVIDGTNRGARRIELQRGMGGAPLPGWSADPGVRGRITALSAQTGREPSIWNRQQDNWPPKPGDRVLASSGTREAGRWTVLAGTIRDVSREGEHLWSMTVADEMTPLRTLVSMWPLAYLMRPMAPGMPLRRPGLCADYYAHRAFRAAGINNTPPWPGGWTQGVSAPLQGSGLSDAGQLLEAGASSGPTTHNPIFRGAPWGYSLYNGVFYYEATDDVPLPVAKIGIMVGPDHSSFTQITLHNGPGTEVARVTIGAGRSVSVSWGRDADRVVLSMPSRTGWTKLTVTASAATGAVTIDTDDPSTTPISTPYAGGLTFRYAKIDASAGSQVAGFMAASAITGYITHTPQLRLHFPFVYTATLPMMSRMRARTAMELIAQIADRARRQWWVDEDGIHQWMPECVTLGREPNSEDITTDEHVLGDDWAEGDSLDDWHRQVVVTSEWAMVNAARYPEQDCWRGSGVTVNDRGAAKEEVVSVPDDETWIGIDIPPFRMGEAPPPGEEWRSYTAKRGTMLGGVITGPGDRTRWPFPTAFPYDVGRFSLRSTAIDEWTHRVEFAADPGPGIPEDYNIAARTPGAEDGGSLPRWARDRDLPVLRCYVHGKWLPREHTAGNGHSLAGDMEHNGGRWVQGYTGEQPLIYAEHMAGYWIRPLGRITLDIAHDPRRQVGDVANLVDKHRHGITLRVLVLGIKQSSVDEITTADQTMTLELFVLAVERVEATYNDMSRAQRPRTHDQVEAALAGRTYTQVQSDLQEGSL